MGKQLGRWKCSTSLFGPRDGALLRSPVTDIGLVRSRTHDAAPRRRQLDQDPEPGALLCRLGQHGETGDWMAEDCDGNPLEVRRAADGTLTIHHGPGDGDQKDPDQIRMEAPFSRDGNAGAPGDLEAGKAFTDRMAKALAPAKNADQRNPSGIRGLQALMTAHYRRRD
jgi:hypothetical protein